MGRFFFAIKTFFRIIGNQKLAESIKHLSLDAPTPEAAVRIPPTSGREVPKPVPKKRSDALTLLEALQRDARLLDFIYEDIAGYSDAQVGAAVREIHRGTHAILNRIFDIAPVETALEGSPFEVKEQTDSARLRLLGNVTNSRPVIGELVHAGWQARQCELPTWTGTAHNELIIAPAEVEIH